jgi:hypothetical protein
MSRNRGTFPFSANFEGNIRGPIDAKMLVSSQSDLINPSTWINSGLEWTYVGMPVSVSSDPDAANNGMYVLNGSDYTNITNWIKLGTGSGVDSSLVTSYIYGTPQQNADVSLYVYTTGSDVSGDGTAGNPYQTIYRALYSLPFNFNNTNVTINLGPGTFIYDNSCDYIRTKQTNGTVLLYGTTVIDVSNLTFKQPNPDTDPFTYNVSVNGLTPSWATNQWRKYYNTPISGSLIIPISNSSTWSLELADPSLTRRGSNIIHFDSSIILDSENYSGQINFNRANIWINKNITISPISNTANEANVLTTLSQCVIGGSSAISALSISFYSTQPATYYDYFDNVKLVFDNFSSGLVINSVFYFASPSTSAMAIAFYTGSIGSVTNSIFNRDTKFGYAIGYQSGSKTSITSNPALTQYVKFNKVSYPLFIYTGDIVYGDNYKFILNDCDYLLRAGTGFSTVGFSHLFGKVIFDGDLIGTPNIRYFYNGGDLFKKYYDPPYADFHIKNVLYREVDNLRSNKLSNNSVTDLSIGHILQNKSISVTYTLQRNQAYVEGSFNIISDSSNLSANVDRYIKTGINPTIVDASAIRFDALIDSSLIKWRITMDSSGGDASLNYSITRVMKYPLTL